MNVGDEVLYVTVKLEEHIIFLNNADECFVFPFQLFDSPIQVAVELSMGLYKMFA